MENQVSLGKVTNNYMMLYYLNKNIYESTNSKSLWTNYLHNITSGGFNYESAFILFPDDFFVFNQKFFLDDTYSLCKENVDPESLEQFIKDCLENKSVSVSPENTNACIPIINFQNELKALLIVYKASGLTFEDTQLLEIYAQQTVSTIESIILNEKLIFNQNLLGEKIDQFVLLHYVSKEIHDSVKHSEVLKKYLKSLTSELGFNFKSSCIYLFEDNIDKIYLKDDELIFENITSLDKEHLKTAFESKTYSLSEDNKILAIPLISYNNTISAIIEIISEKEIYPEDVQLLDIFAMQTSTMLENTKLNSHLETEVEKRTRELKQAYDELKKMDALKDAFIAMVSHELRTPLTSILAYLETILSSTEDDSLPPDLLKEFLGIIHTESNRLKVIVDDILDLSKLEAGKMNYRFENISINTLINSTAENFYAEANKKDIKIIKNLSQDIPLISVDSVRIMQVLSNIISNAIKFTPNKKSIHISSYTENGFVLTEIKDEGIGIKKEDFSKVFSKFEQIEHIDHHAKGTGLGMPISKMLIDQMHGELSFDSEYGKGTSFFIKFPIVKI